MKSFNGAVPAEDLRDLAFRFPKKFFTVRYIAISGGNQTLENFEGKYLDWFNTDSLGVITITKETD